MSLPATLVRNTERKLVAERRKTFGESSLTESIGEGRDLAAEQHESTESRFGIPPDARDEEAVAVLFAALEELIGREGAVLLIGKAVGNKNCLELSRELGITREAAMKRFQRALARARRRLAERDALSGEPPAGACSSR